MEIGIICGSPGTVANYEGVCAVEHAACFTADLFVHVEDAVFEGCGISSEAALLAW